MKIYLYSGDNGTYLGEDYFDTAQVGDICELPENATTAKPPECGPGQVAVFNQQTNTWEMSNRQ